MALEVGEAYVSLVPSARNFGRTMQTLLRADMDRAGRQSSTEFARAFASGIQASMGIVSGRMGRSMRGVGSDMARDVLREMRVTLAGSAANAPNLNIDANVNGVQATAEFRALLANLETISRANPVNIHVAVNSGVAAAQLTGAVAAAQAPVTAASAGAGTTAGTAFGGAWVGAAALAIGAGAGIVVAGASIIGVKTAAEMEQASIAFETMLGSGQKARTFLEDLKKFAASTPFEFPELQTAASSLISAGFAAEDVIPIMKSLGNATSGMGTGSEGVKRATVALQQMSAAGKITGEDLNQLRDAGIPVFDLLAAATGKTKDAIAELAQKGKLGKKEMTQLFDALKNGKGLERFNGLMEKQSQSLSGLFSTLKDNLQMGLADAFEPLVPYIKAAMGRIAPAIQGAMKSLADSFTGAITVGTQLVDLFHQYELPVKIVAGVVMGAAVAIGAFTLATTVASVAVGVFNAVLALNPITWIVLAVGALVGALVVLYRNVEPVRVVMDALWESIKSGAAAIRDFLAPILTAAWEGVIQPIFSALGVLVQAVWVNIVRPALVGMWTFISTVLAPALVWFWSAVVQPVWGWIGAKVSEVWAEVVRPAVAAFAGYIRNTLAPATASFWPVVRTIFTSVGNHIRTVWGGIRLVFDALKDGIGTVKTVFSQQVSAMKKIWDGLKTVVGKPVKFVVDTVINKGLIGGWNKVAGMIGQNDKKIRAFPLPKELAGFSDGGYTGRLPWNRVAGVVHGDEQVIKAKSRRKIEASHPGVLDYMNEHGAIPGYRSGGRVMPNSRTKPWPKYVAALVTKLFPQVGDIYGQGNRPIRTSYHHTGDALDFMVGKNRPLGNSIAAWGVKNWAPLLLDQIIWYERIKSSKGGGAWRPYRHPFGSNDTLAHRDHPHFSFSRGKWGNPNALGAKLSQEEMDAAMKGGGFSVGSPMGMLAKGALKASLAAVRLGLNGMSALFGKTNNFVPMVAGTGNKLTDMFQGWAEKKIDSLTALSLPSLGGGGDGKPDEANLGGIKGIVQQVAAKYGWGGGAQWAAIDWIVNHESSWNPNAKNPNSTAYGLFQFLNSTWGSTGISKTSNPALQAEAAMKYFGSRYGTPVGAKAFWERNRWYDQGGILPPGMTVAMNGTGKNEHIYTDRDNHIIASKLDTIGTQSPQHPITMNIGKINSRREAQEIMRQLRDEQRKQAAADRVRAAMQRA